MRPKRTEAQCRAMAEIVRRLNTPDPVPQRYTIDDVDARRVIERCADALRDLGACEDPDCTEPNCNHALPLAMEWLRKKEDEG